jgi:hypothetical protein
VKYHAFNGRNGVDDLLELTPTEHAHYKAEADKRGVTVEELVRMAIERAYQKYGAGK